MRRRKQTGTIVQIGSRWFLRYWQRVTIAGQIERKLVSHPLGPVTTRGKRPPADVELQAERHMVGVNSRTTPVEHIVSMSDFVEQVFLPEIEKSKRPSTFRSYAQIWRNHLSPLCRKMWLREVRTHHVQRWLDHIGGAELSRNTLSHVKNLISGIFSLAMQQEYFSEAANPARNARINPQAAPPAETYAYSLDEIQAILSLLPEPAATAFAVAGYAGLRHGEIQGLRWEDYHHGQLFVSRSIWNGREGDPKTEQSKAPVPVTKQLTDRLEMHRLRSAQQTGPIFVNGKGNPLALSSVVNRVILPALNRCAICGASQLGHNVASRNHSYVRDDSIPQWHGWHAARRGLGSNLYRLGVTDKVIQRILRHSNVSTTTGYYIKTADDDARVAMLALETAVQPLTNTERTLTAPEIVQSGRVQ